MLYPGPFQRGPCNHLSTLLLPGDITQITAQSSRTVPLGCCFVTLGNLGISPPKRAGQVTSEEGVGRERARVGPSHLPEGRSGQRQPSV